MPLTSPPRPDRGGVCEVCGGEGCSKFTTHDWPGGAPFRPGTRDEMAETAEHTDSDESPQPEPRPRGRRARRPVEDRAVHGPVEDR